MPANNDIASDNHKTQDSAHSFIHTLVQQFQQLKSPLPPHIRKLKSTTPDLVKTDLKQIAAWLEDAHHYFRERTQVDTILSVTAEWILDNYYIIQQSIQQIEEDLPFGYQQQLPKLAGSSLAGLPRVFALSRSILAYQNYLLDLEAFQSLLLTFQKESPLEMGELWAVPIFLRFSLLEKLTQTLLAFIDPPNPPNLPSYAAHTPDLVSVPTSDQTLVDNHHSEQVANIIRSLRQILEADFKIFFESVSLVEASLRQDPAGIYAHMDFKTRNLYRSEVEALAKAAGVSEHQLTETLLTICQAASQSQAESDTQLPEAITNQAAHVGTYLIGDGHRVLEEHIHFKPSLHLRVKRWASAHARFLYLAGIFSLAFLSILLIFLLLRPQATFANLSPLKWLALSIIVLSTLPPTLIVANHLVNSLLLAALSPRLLPKMDFEESIPDAFQTLIVIPGLITDQTGIENLVRQLEIHYLSNPQPGLKYALLTDYADADSETRPEDETLLEAACQAIATLNDKHTPSQPDFQEYSQLTESQQRFFILHRRRQWNPSQNRWMGWERKRGKLAELNQLLRGSQNTSYFYHNLSPDALQDLQSTRFVITADADTVLPPGAAVRLVGTLAHPLNQAHFNPDTGQVISGYTILQPRVEVHPRSAHKTWFTRIFAGDTGLDLYTHAVSDVYQDLFGEGSFVGKGIYAVDPFVRSTSGRIPENSLLSHDLLEGILGLAGLVSDITLIEDYPKNYYEQIMRQRRWTRGDWQLLPWLLKPERYNTRLNAIDRWKMSHNLLRSLLSPSLLAILLLGLAFLPNLTWIWVLIALFAFGLPLFSDLPGLLIQSLVKKQTGLFLNRAKTQVLRWLLALAFLPYEAYCYTDAILVTLYRIFISHHDLLTWTTAEHTARLFKSRYTQNKAWHKLILSAMLAVAFILAAQSRSLLIDSASALALSPVIPIVLLWFLSPLLVKRVNKPLPDPQDTRPFKEPAILRVIARRTWGYFERFVSPQNHWLPPDHFQEKPNEVIAHYTSPSNIGLYLTATVAAYDLGYLDLLGLVARLQASMQTLDQLPRHRGHFLNWYSTRTLEPLDPRYVSTVDSGNLAASFIILTQSCLKMVTEPAFRWQLWEAYLDSLISLSGILSKIKTTATLPQIDQILQGINTLRSKILAVKDLPEQWYERFQQDCCLSYLNLSQQLTNLIDPLQSAIDLETFHRLQETIRQIESQQLAVQRVINELIPWIPFLEQIPPLLQETAYQPFLTQLDGLLTYNPSLQQIITITQQVQGPITALKDALHHPANVSQPSADALKETLNWLEGLTSALIQAGSNAQELTNQFQSLANQANTFINEMEFGFLYDPSRKVFHIGYNLDTGQLDNNYYDLLASEARIASLIAISRGQVPQSHWIHLSRPITQINGDVALLSWSATMFEYLMPTLYLHSYPSTLLYSSAISAVKYQRMYAKSRGVPWGISESGFYQFDANQNYQYRAFGVPGLGFKRGLSEDLVISPYASLMAIKMNPAAVEVNILSLISKKALGLYGFYEAIDFTKRRLPAGENSAVVQEYMAHHQGMILMALDNYLHDDIMVRRIHHDPQVQSVDLLLQEQIPSGVPLLNPGEEEIQAVRRTTETPVEISAWTEPVESDLPRLHLLSNGYFTTFISNRGAGFSRWKGIDLTRWQADGVMQPWGTWIYIQDIQKGSVSYPTWSAAAQPLPDGADEMQVSYFAHMAVFRRTQNKLATSMQVTIAPEDPVEIRRIQLINNQGLTRHLRLTSYGEPILTLQGEDARHPAFNKLFIESDFIPNLGLQIFKHRKHADHDQPVWLGHMLVEKNNGNKNNSQSSLAHEADRYAFIGRGHTLQDPLALQSGSTLNGSSGITLDPIFSLGKRVKVKPHATLELAFLTFAASDKQSLLEIAERYNAWSRIQNAFREAEVASLTWLGRQKVQTESLKTNLHLLSVLLYPHSHLRADPEVLAANRLNQTGLWRFGISGDYPIILLELEDTQHLDLLIEVLRAQAFLRDRSLEADLLILNCQTSQYTSEFQEQIIRAINKANLQKMLNQRGGIFILTSDQMHAEERTLLRASARLLLRGDRGSLSQQIQVEPEPLADLPRLIPSHPSRRELPGQLSAFRQHNEGLQFFNGLGGFSPDGKEYVLELPEGQSTPAPWANVIGYPHFGFMVTESGSQTTWALNSGENRLTPWSNDPVMDPSGELLYLRDEETGDVWTPTPQPAPAPGPHRIRHGAGFTVFESESFGLKQTLTLFGSPQDPLKIYHLQLKNTLADRRRLTATCYAEWVLGTTHADTHPYLIPGYHPEQAMLTVRNPYHPELGERVAFLMANKTLHGHTYDRAEFFGKAANYRCPAALNRIGLSGKLAIGGDPCAALQVHIDLLPGASEELYFVLGEAKDANHAISLAKKYQDPSAIGDALSQTHAFWEELLTRIQVGTPDPAANLMLNRWYLYQSLSCRVWGRSAFYQSSGAFGFRDQLQDVLALLDIDPFITKTQILNAASRQFEEGDVLHWWHPPSGRGVRTRISDNLLWLPYIACHYAQHTGDSSFWDEKLPFLQAPPLKADESERYGFYEQSPQSGTLFEHCLRALQKGSTSGPHGLPLMGTGDWNDGFNRVGKEGKGESIWLGWFLCDILRRFALICEERGHDQAARSFREQADAYALAIEDHAWDGNWYLRAFYDDGRPLGSHQDLECQIDAIAQSWALISGAGDQARSRQAIDAVWQRLVSPEHNLCLLFTPPFDQSPQDPGYIKSYPPGTRENGGQYTHAAAWTAWAFAELGDGVRAWHLYDMLNPIYQADTADRAQQYRVEPYVCAADVYSQEPWLRRGGWTWYTGSAAWLYRLGIEALLGFHKEGDTLRIEPVIPPNWDGYLIEYRFGNSLYKIQIHNPQHLMQGVCQLTLDGEDQTEPLIYLHDDGCEHHADLRLVPTT